MRTTVAVSLAYVLNWPSQPTASSESLTFWGRERETLMDAIVRVASVLSLAVLSFAAPALGQSRYTVVDLGLLPGANEAYAYGMNGSGQVVGTCWVGNAARACFWDAVNDVRDLPTLGGRASWAEDVNDAGRAVGWSDTNLIMPYHRRAVLWDQGVITNLGTLHGGDSQAQGINNKGTIVGYGAGATYPRAFVWESGVMRDIEALLPPNSDWHLEFAEAINDCDHIVGAGRPPGTTNRHGFLFRRGQVTDLGSFGGYGSHAYDLNDTGMVVGDADFPGGASHAFLWDGGVMTDLGTLGGRESWAVAINESAQIVGRSRTAAESTIHAFLWEPASGMVDLNTLIAPDCGWTLMQAWDVNDQGWIVGSGYRSNVGQRAFLLVPEPATLLLVILGSSMVIARRRRSLGDCQPCIRLS